MQVEAKVINVLCNGAGIGGVLNPISCPSHEADWARSCCGHIPIALDNAAGVRCSASKIDAATC